ncbi:MAG TPA: twin-arginine translocase subunit TatC [Solirubrobacteraceae bacterium]|jgi:sec-independent protein translocase protein TatC|nr:twin-arginine translocase subunit TatC [Solirubrobacteraceae bacterium]
MPKVLRPIGHEDRLSIVDHLDELRSRLIVCGVALAVAFGVCFWQSSALLNLLNRPLSSASHAAANHLGGLTKDSVSAAHHFANSASLLQALSRSSDVSAGDATLLAAAAQQLKAGANALPQTNPKTIPVTLGVGEGFTTTLTVSFYFAVLITLPILLYEAYAFMIPALSPTERRVATPIIFAAPALFVAGVVFTYVIVLPAAVRFLQGYHSQDFNNLVQAKPLYSFEVLTMGAIGLAFQLPLALLGLRQLGVINGSTLTRHWRYATVIIAVIAAAMPGADPVTTGLETLPLVILFIASIVMLKLADRRDARRAAAELIKLGSVDGPGDLEA